MSSAEPVAWVLNLDAEDELGHAGHHTPTTAITARVVGLLPGLCAPGGLVGPDDQLLWPGDGRVEPGRAGRAWCPTPWALRRLERAGLRLPTAPPAGVLRRVNDRRFANALGQALPAAGFARSREELEQLLAATRALEQASAEVCWLLKRPLGYAGRGRRRLHPGARAPEDEAWLVASLRDCGGLQVEPWVERELDCALHGWLDVDGRCTLGQPTLQELDEAGVWRASALAPAGTLSAAEAAALTGEALRTARALHEAGYFGPFGLDAFRWRAPGGQVHFQPRCELNARYSMGWATGLGAFRAPAGLP
jgi:hypothetical protein